jgi:hypothetical protein
MSIALSPPISSRAWPKIHVPLRTGILVAKVGAAVAVVAGALGFAVIDLAAPSVPADHAVVTPAPHGYTGPGSGPLPALQLPTGY